MAKSDKKACRQTADAARIQKMLKRRAAFGAAYRGLSDIAAQACGCERRAVAVAYPGARFAQASADARLLSNLPREYYTTVRGSGMGRV